MTNNRHTQTNTPTTNNATTSISETVKVPTTNIAGIIRRTDRAKGDNSIGGNINPTPTYGDLID